MDHQAQQELRDLAVHRDREAAMDIQVSLESLVLRVSQAIRAPLVVQDQAGSRVPQELLDQLDQLDRKEMPDLLGPTVRMVRRERPD